jgi:hypothetical protein
MFEGRRVIREKQETGKRGANERQGESKKVKEKGKRGGDKRGQTSTKSNTPRA